VVDGDHPEALAGAGGEARVGHPERREDALLQRCGEIASVERLDHLTEPVDVDAVLEAGAGVVDERDREGRPQAAERIGRVGDLLVAQHFGTRERIGVAGGVGEELTDGGLARGCAQAGRVAVEAVEHLQLSVCGQDRRDGTVEVELPLFDELQRGDAHERLGHRRDAPHRIRLDARGGLVADALRAGDDHRGARDGPRRHGSLQQSVDRACPRIRHRQDLLVGIASPVTYCRPAGRPRQARPV
jgi:hypothetical protein